MITRKFEKHASYFIFISLIQSTSTFYLARGHKNWRGGLYVPRHNIKTQVFYLSNPVRGQKLQEAWKTVKFYNFFQFVFYSSLPSSLAKKIILTCYTALKLLQFSNEIFSKPYTFPNTGLQVYNTFSKFSKYCKKHAFTH